ncbi:MAG: NAD-dependent epimerase/dehydratase family protein [Proteobacteria bacterium]|nr:NAD-dependent epimerase/dehydratase family protein [Pseudomonadota bacterium]
MRILVTGGAGFIGSHLVDFLLGKGYFVVVIDNLSLGKIENIEHNFGNPYFSFHKFDVLDYEKLIDLFKKYSFDVIFHLSANSDIAKSHEDPDIDLKNTFLSTYYILKAMKDSDVKNLVFASTSAIYGEAKGKIREDFGPLFPLSHYGASKLASEAFISSFAENYGFKAWIIRFPNVVGVRATHGVIFDFINKLRENPDELVILGDGTQNKPYLYVTDLIEAMVFIWEHTNDKINYFNVGVGTRTTVKKIAEIVCEEMGLKPEIKFTGGDRGWIGDVPEFDYSLDKIHRLGWFAKMTSDEAVRKAVRAILGKEK